MIRDAHAIFVRYGTDVESGGDGTCDRGLLLTEKKVRCRWRRVSRTKREQDEDEHTGRLKGGVGGERGGYFLAAIGVETEEKIDETNDSLEMVR